MVRHEGRVDYMVPCYNSGHAIEAGREGAAENFPAVVPRDHVAFASLLKPTLFARWPV